MEVWCVMILKKLVLKDFSAVDFINSIVFTNKCNQLKKEDFPCIKSYNVNFLLEAKYPGRNSGCIHKNVTSALLST